MRGRRARRPNDARSRLTSIPIGRSIGRVTTHRREIDALFESLKEVRPGKSPYSPYFLVLVPPLVTVLIGARAGFSASLLVSEMVGFLLIVVALATRNVALSPPTPEAIERAIDGVPELPLGRQWVSFVGVLLGAVVSIAGPFIGLVSAAR